MTLVGDQDTSAIQHGRPGKLRAGVPAGGRPTGPGREPDRHEASQGTWLRHPIVRYALALAAVGVAGLLRALLGAQFPGLVPFATFFPAVLIATLLGGLGPGLLATALSASGPGCFWLQPPAALAPPVGRDLGQPRPVRRRLPGPGRDRRGDAALP